MRFSFTIDFREGGREGGWKGGGGDHFLFSVNYSLSMVVCGTFSTHYWEASQLE